MSMDIFCNLQPVFVQGALIDEKVHVVSHYLMVWVEQLMAGNAAAYTLKVTN